MNCSNCGSEISNDAKFCRRCGATIQGSTGHGQSSGVNENILGLLCYLIGFLAIIFLLTEKQNKFIRFHAIQSVLFNVAYFFIAIFIALIDPFILFSLVSLLFIVVGIVLMYKAYQGEKYKLPVIGDYAENKA